MADGYQAIKFDIDHAADELSHDTLSRGLSLAELDKMTALVAAVREAVGPSIDVCIDCHGIYNVRDVILLAKRLEPLRPDVSGRSGAAGEHRRHGQGDRRHLDSHLHRRVGPSPRRLPAADPAAGLRHAARGPVATGGLLEAKKIADLADLYYMPFAAHNITSPLGMTAAAHVCAAVRNLHSLELPYHADQVPWRWDLVESAAPLIEDGLFVVPQTPGLGVELNESIARAHLKPGYTLF